MFKEVSMDNRIEKLNKILASLKKQLLPERKKQYEVMSKIYINKIKELQDDLR